MGYEVGECHIVAVYLRLVIPRTLYVPLLEHCFISNFKYREKLKLKKVKCMKLIFFPLW